jgi:hypothetical protein
MIIYAIDYYKKVKIILPHYETAVCHGQRTAWDHVFSLPEIAVSGAQPLSPASCKP